MFIAEIGINHGGNLDIAKELILMAKRAGADIVKLQKRNVEENILEQDRGTSRKTLNGIESYEQYKHNLEFNCVDYKEIDIFCKEIDIKWTVSVWDIPSIKFISHFDVPFIKVPSARINEIEYLKALNDTKKPIVISIGMSTNEEVIQALDILDNVETIMYCKSIYPPSDSDLNLKTIIYLKEKYPKIKIGYSSHDTSIYPILCASVLGAEIFEAHITLNKNMYGSDQKCSFEESELTEIIKLVNKSKLWLGEPKIDCLESEKISKDRLRRV